MTQSRTLRGVFHSLPVLILLYSTVLTVENLRHSLGTLVPYPYATLQYPRFPPCNTVTVDCLSKSLTVCHTHQILSLHPVAASSHLCYLVNVGVDKPRVVCHLPTEFDPESLVCVFS